MSRAHAALAGALIAAILMVVLGGCAALPMPFQPTNTLGFDSSTAEGAFIVSDMVDTLQTMHLREERNPQTQVKCNHEADPIAAALYGGQYPSKNRVLITNVLLLTAHTMVASWLDDRVAAESTKSDAGLWYIGRLTFHAISIGYSTGSVLNNIKQGCRL
jgi:hypothetical protein